jgi:hypothetical protein
MEKNRIRITELVKRVAEQKRRRGEACAAVEAARSRVRARRQFIPKRFKPADAVRVKF